MSVVAPLAAAHTIAKGATWVRPLLRYGYSAYRNRGLIKSALGVAGAMAYNFRKRKYVNYRGSNKRRRVGGRGGSPRGNTAGVTPVTAQYDAARIQRARPLDGRSKRYIRRFKRFRSKIREVQSSEVPNSFIVRQSTRTITTASSVIPNATQAVDSLGFVDNAPIAQAFTAASLNAAVGSEDTLSLRGAACELMLQCLGNGTSQQSAQVDVYLIKARKGISSAQASAPEDQWIAATTALTDSGGNPTPMTWGVTPFEAPAFCKMWKVMQTWRLNLTLGGLPTTLEKTVKLGGRRITGNQLASNRQLKGSWHWLFVVHGMPTEGVAGGFIGTRVEIRYNQTLHYEVFSPASANRVKNL